MTSYSMAVLICKFKKIQPKAREVIEFSLLFSWFSASVAGLISQNTANRNNWKKNID